MCPDISERYSLPHTLSSARPSFFFPFAQSLVVPFQTVVVPSTIVMPESSTAVQLPSPVYFGDERTPQAGLFPTKRGEIGFTEGVHGFTNTHDDDGATFSLPARHPADRDYQSPSTQTVGGFDESSSNSSTNNKRLFGRLRTKKVPSIGGIQPTTLLLFTIQLLAFGGTVALWVVAARKVNAGSVPRQFQNSVGSLTAFIHVMFAVGALAQIVFLERRLYCLRSERYQHVHGDVLPRHRHSPSTSDSIVSAAPWNRRPLPTYAAVLAQSGVGTGDVEDNLIAIPPPPPYGVERESTLLYSAR